MADDELLDVYDEQGVHLGVERRDVVHREGLWHRCFHLWVVSGPDVLLQRRSPRKDTHPGLLDATVAGHLGAGEGVAEGGAREVAEELGVHFAAGELVPIGVRTMSDRVGPGGRWVNRERQHLFLVADDRPLSAWTAFDRGEVDGLVALGLASFARLAGPDVVPAQPARAWDGARVTRTQIAREEIIPGPYLPALAAVLTRFAAGERDLAV